MLLCVRCSNGDVTLQDDEVTFQLRISSDEWRRTKAVLLAKNLIDDRNLPVAWNKRQFSSDSSAARVAKHRETKKRQCNVTVTPPDTDTDTEKPPPISPPSAGKAKRGSIFPEGFQPDETGIRLARELGLTRDELVKFADHHRAKGTVMKDWQAAWRTWARNAVKFRQQTTSGPLRTDNRTEHQRRQDATTRAMYGSLLDNHAGDENEAGTLPLLG
jgi:hypothetical protein